MERELLLLGLLRQQEMHGYQLHEFIERDLSVCINMKKPTAYYLLKKMSQDGWITEELAREGNRPTKKVYRLTAAGEAAFQRLLRENLSTYRLAEFSDEIGLAFLESLDAEEAVRLLSQRRKAVSEALASAMTAPQHQGSLQWIIERQIQRLKNELTWMDEIIARLEESGS